MNAFWFGVVFMGPWFLFGYALWRIYFRNRFEVEPNNRERVVIQNAVTGTMAVLGPGTHFRGPWWKLFKRVPVNREPVQITGEECKSKDGVRLKIDYRYDMLSGRPFDQKDPQSANFGKLLDEKLIDPEVVKLAVTAIDFDERKDRIHQVVMAVVEAAIGAKEADELLVPTTGTAALYGELNKTVERGTDHDLTFVGINILDFRITNLRALDDKLQEAYENKKRLAKLRESAAEARGDPKAPPQDRITYREALAAGTDQFGTVVLGQAAGDAARALSRGLSDIGKGLGKK